MTVIFSLFVKTELELALVELADVPLKGQKKKTL